MAAEDSSKKFILVGDGTCGKTSLLTVYFEGRFPTDYLPTVFDSRTKTLQIDDRSLDVTLMDTSGQEDYERLRALQYYGGHLFVLCFAIDNRTSYQNISSKWIGELKSYKLPLVLVATKSDLRTEVDDCVTTEEGEKLAKKIHARAYLECSAKKEQGIHEIFEKSARVVLGVEEKRTKCCLL